MPERNSPYFRAGMIHGAYDAARRPSARRGYHPECAGSWMYRRGFARAFLAARKAAGRRAGGGEGRRVMAYNGGREVAYCAICGHMHDTLDPAVRFVYGDGRWECADEVACFARRAELGTPDTVVFDELMIKRIEHAFGAMPPARPGK